MMTIKAGRPLIEMAKLCHRADRPLLVVGRHGVGKSELLRRAADELKIRFVCRDLSLMEPVDLVGLPRMDGAVTRYLPPSFLPSDGQGLLVFEELNRCPSFMRAPTLQLLTSRTLNDYELPRGWLPVAAINPLEGEYEVEVLDPALLSRFVRVAVEPDRLEWLEWARSRGVHPGVIAYIESDTTVFHDAESNPRAWAYISDIVVASAQSGAPQESLRAAIVGLVGPERGAAFLRVLHEDVRPLTAAEVLTYTRHRARFRDWVGAGRLDLVQGTLMALMKHLQARRNFESVRGDRSAWKHLGAFLADLPADLREETEAFFQERGYDVPGAPARGRRYTYVRVLHCDSTGRGQGPHRHRAPGG
jgi:MoxR-like ATPase